MDVGTVVLLVYLAGAMVALVPTARWFLREMMDGFSDGGDYVMCAALALCFVWFWPFYIPGWWIVKMLKSG